MSAEQISPKGAHHPNNFGAIRLLLAIMVVFHHAFSLSVGNLHGEPLTMLTGTLGPGTVAVYGFFALSGFLITQSWCRQPKLYPFCRNRFLRIYPGYVGAMVFAIFLVGWLGSDVSDYYQRLRLPQVVKCLGFFVIPLNFPSFGNQTLHGNLNGAVWTIAFEVTCYMLVASAGATRLLRRSLAWPALGVVLLAIRPSDVTTFVQHWIRVPYCYFFGGMCELLPFFLAGVCFYLYQERIRFTRTGALLMGVVLLSCVFNTRLAPVGYAIAGTYLLFATGFAKIPGVRPIGQRVDLSYGIYLYHWPLQQLLLRYVPSLTPWTLFALSLPLVLGMAWLSWSFVEGPCLRWGKRKALRLSAPANSGASRNPGPAS